MTDHSRLDHRRFVASLTPNQRRELTKKSNWQALMSLALHAGAIVLVGSLIVQRVPGLPALMIVQGVLLVFLFTLLHESVHRTAFRTRAINDLVSRICSVLILLPADWFRHFHMAHHRHTQDPGRDPELAEDKPERVSDYVLHVSGLPLWRSQIATLWRNASGGCRDEYIPTSSMAAVVREARWMIALYAALALASLAAGSSVLLWVWIVPLMLGQPFLRLYLLAEHGRCPTVSNMFDNTRTTLSNALVRRLAWNMPFHAEHHCYPAVPFHRLPELHALVDEHLGVISPGYVAFNRRYLAGVGGASRSA